MSEGPCVRCRHTGFGYLSTKLRALRDRTGVPYLTLYVLATNVLQLSWAGFSPAQVRRAITAMHPHTMSNLTLTPKLELELKSPGLVWERHGGWTKRRALHERT